MKKLIAVVAILLGIALAAGGVFLVRDIAWNRRLADITNTSQAVAGARDCPVCGKKMKPIVYGLPTADMSTEGVILGGCIVTGHDPAYYCEECRQYYYKDLKPADRSRN